jgi:hypothetical protein
MLAKLSTNQIPRFLFETVLTLYKTIEINYENQFKINKIL